MLCISVMLTMPATIRRFCLVTNDRFSLMLLSETFQLHLLNSCDIYLQMKSFHRYIHADANWFNSCFAGECGLHGCFVDPSVANYPVFYGTPLILASD